MLSQHYLLIKQQNHRCWDFPANTIELGYKFPESFGEIDSLGSRSVEDYNQGVAPVNAVDSNFWLEFPQVLDILGQVKSFIFLQEYLLFDQVFFFFLGDKTVFTLWQILKLVLLSLLIIICMLIAVAYYTLAERKVMAFMQRRKGPNVVGFWGLLQPLADGVKLLFKEVLIPRKANKVLFLFAPFLSFVLALIGWTVIPFSEFFVYADTLLGVLFLLAISSLGVYGVIIAGWASNSNYAFLGALRSTAQMISYEITISFVVITVIFFTGSYNLTDIVVAQELCWFIFPLLPIALIFFVCMLAETNRAPFDLPEAEAELVAGYNVDYSSITFAMFFLGEYSNMLLMSTLMVILFFGGWLPFTFLGILGAEFTLALKIGFFAFCFIWVRATLPRYRYDQLMSLGWKAFLPFTFGFFLFLCGLFFAFENFNIITFELDDTGLVAPEFLKIWRSVTQYRTTEVFGAHIGQISPEIVKMLVHPHWEYEVAFNDSAQSVGFFDYIRAWGGGHEFTTKLQKDLSREDIFFKYHSGLASELVCLLYPDYERATIGLFGRFHEFCLYYPWDDVSRLLRSFY